MFGLRDAEIVRAVARAGGFRAAAGALKLAPSAVSARVAQIERALGLRLFDRSRRGARLTPEGRRFLERAAGLIELRDAIAGDIAGEGIEGTLRIGVAETVVHTSLPGLLRRLGERAPKLRLELSVDVSENLQRALVEDAIDIALLLRQWVPRGAASRPVERVDLDWFAAPGLLPDGAGAMEPERLRALPVITFARGTPPAREVERLLGAAGAPRAVVHGSSSLATMIHLARAGLGVGTLPAALVAGDCAAGRLRRLDFGDAMRLSPLEFELCHLAPSVARFAAMLGERA